ncbi:Aste57867_25298 [Aphanomyces stellatus]|uniref:Aste57867_25298 protein n=1 Tax=Aphanomyces stellatus TaxID=120398 RepID=A0A485LSR0_9STRA|nr:hypothetical protein As57867_025220 [Aphanomyces stellatus]VFU01923.1 Aste57867_25298 [Aphanomyces stellatus]
MSSIRVRATNKLLTKLGATKPSKNTQFDVAFQGFEQLQSGIVNLDNALKGYIMSLRGFHAASNVLLRAIEEVSNFRCSDIPSESPEVKQFVDVFKACSVNADIAHFTELTKKFETRVQTPAQGWVHQVDTLRKECHDFEETHLTYDHYTKKVLALRDAHNKRAGAGKQEKGKEVDKLVRNEEKLVAVSNEYNQASEKTVTHLRDFLRHRDSTLLPLVQRMIEFRLDYSSTMLDATKKMEPLLKISGYDEHLSTLEGFAPNGHATTEKRASATPADESHIAASDIQVNKLSFDAFIGTSESPATDTWCDFPTSASSPPASTFATTPFEPFASAPPPAPTTTQGVANGPRTNSGGRTVNVLDFSEPPQATNGGSPTGFMDFGLDDIHGSPPGAQQQQSPFPPTHMTAAPAAAFNPFAPATTPVFQTTPPPGATPAAKSPFDF